MTITTGITVATVTGGLAATGHAGGTTTGTATADVGTATGVMHATGMAGTITAEVTTDVVDVAVATMLVEIMAVEIMPAVIARAAVTTTTGAISVAATTLAEMIFTASRGNVQEWPIAEISHVADAMPAAVPAAMVKPLPATPGAKESRIARSPDSVNGDKQASTAPAR